MSARVSGSGGPLGLQTPEMLQSIAVRFRLVSVFNAFIKEIRTHADNINHKSRESIQQYTQLQSNM